MFDRQDSEYASEYDSQMKDPGKQEKKYQLKYLQEGQTITGKLRK